MNDHIEGYIENIIFRNEENGYTVFETSVNRQTVTCTGILPSVNEGEYIVMDGNYSVHPVYGEQFKVLNFKTCVPGDMRALERYLGSGAIKGIGPALAGRIIRHFGEDTLRIIEEEPERLSEVKGISDNKACAISAQVIEKSQVQDAMIYLSGLGISLNLSMKIYTAYGEKVYSILKENPYKLASDIHEVGFKTADAIAEKSGISKSSPFRIASAIEYVLRSALADGNLYLPEEVLKARAEGLLGIESDYLNDCIDELSISGKIIRKKDKENQTIVYISDAYYTELNTARMLTELNVKIGIDKALHNKVLKGVLKNLSMEIDELQINAIEEAASNGVFILTGGPGTGKTTTINAMIRYFMAMNKSILLAAPTGRAAKRMKEATGFEASTIHRMLELFGDPSNDDNRVRFQRNKENPLEADVIIIDEMSMVDTFLMHSLVSAVLPGTNLILVGDMNQLPSVGPGRVLADMINCGVFPVIKLNKIFRQAAKSGIVVNAHKINDGEELKLDNSEQDFLFLERSDYRITQRGILTLVQDKLPKFTNCDVRDVQVVCPMKKGVLGVESINNILQRYLNPASENKAEKEMPFGCFREGDKVMQIKNDYQLYWEIRGLYGIVSQSGEGVFNGDIGVIESIRTFDQTVTVIFDDNKYVTYAFSQLDELELAYAITVHKSQGSEYPAVVMPVLDGPPVLMTRNLLYTAITRAKKCVVLLGSKDMINFMIRNEREDSRYSTLGEMIISLNS